MSTSIGKEIKRERLLLGLNQTEFGELFGCKQQEIHRYENNITTPRIDRLKAMAEYFDKEWVLR